MNQWIFLTAFVVLVAFGVGPFILAGSERLADQIRAEIAEPDWTFKRVENEHFDESEL